MTEQKLILIIDDEQYWRERTAAAVRSCGFEPVLAAGIRETYRVINEETFALIITDNNMEMSAQDGIEVLQLATACFGNTFPTILQSSATPKDLEVILKVFPNTTFIKKDRFAGDEKLIAAIKQKL
jgi:DNA-binding NtrC family response regulator